MHLSVVEDGASIVHHRLDTAIDRSAGPAARAVPHAVVPAHAWQAAETTGAWSLLTCIVAPGFDFAGFELAPPGWEPGAGPRAPQVEAVRAP